jgi:ankyrin repeat protein
MVFGLFSKKKKLLKAIEDGEVDEVAPLLENFDKINEAFAKPDDEDVMNWSYLLHSCRFGNKEIVELILGKGADLNNQDSDEAPPIYWAACNDDEEGVKICTFLIEKGVDINYRTKDRGTALILSKFSSRGATSSTSPSSIAFKSFFFFENNPKTITSSLAPIKKGTTAVAIPLYLPYTYT